VRAKTKTTTAMILGKPPPKAGIADLR